MTTRVAINGFGRIGRLVLRALIESDRRDIDVVAINDLGPVETNAHLFRYDSVHGRFPNEVKVSGDTMSVGRGSMKVTAIKDPAQLPHKELGIDIAFECTGIFTSKEKASAHLKAGAKRVLISAPGEGADLTVVYGVNDDKLRPEHTVVSNASCTTNCLGPLAAVLNKAMGIEHGFMTTIHSYTGDQPTLDTMHKDLYRARAAALNIIPTTTGAAKAVGLVLPEWQARRRLHPRADAQRVAHRLQVRGQAQHDVRGGEQRAHRGVDVEPPQGHHLGHQGEARLFRPQPRSLFGDRCTRPDQGDGRQLRARGRLIRQRVGFLQPHGRHRGRNGPARLGQDKGRAGFGTAWPVKP